MGSGLPKVPADTAFAALGRGRDDVVAGSHQTSDVANAGWCNGFFFCLYHYHQLSCRDEYFEILGFRKSMPGLKEL